MTSTLHQIILWNSRFKNHINIHPDNPVLDVFQWMIKEQIKLINEETGSFKLTVCGKFSGFKFPSKAKMEVQKSFSTSKNKTWFALFCTHKKGYSTQKVEVQMARSIWKIPSGGPEISIYNFDAYCMLQYDFPPYTYCVQIKS